MKKSLWALALAIPGAIAFSNGASAGDADFTLVNRTGYAINEVYISPSKSSKWGSDKLGDVQLLNGDRRKFVFGDNAHCHQDIKVIFTDDKSEVEWTDVNLCELTKVVLKYDKSTNEVSYESE